MLKSFEKSAPAPGGEPDEFVMSDSTLDRVGDVVDVNGWELGRIKSDPVVYSTTTAIRCSASGPTFASSGAS